MLSLTRGADADLVLTGLAGKVRERLGPVVIGVGEAADSIKDVRRSFLEAGQVADVAATLGETRPAHES
jgi:PucR family transcriptional regulator, purine catabolism regulatory protein